MARLELGQHAAMTRQNEPYTLPEAEGETKFLLGPTIAGFLKIRENGKIIDPTSAGSGVFVRWPGDIHGILTAAHVLDRLPEDIEIGLLVFTRKDAIGQFKFKISKDQKVYPDTWRGEGLPDVAFVRLYDPELGKLKAKGCVFYNLEHTRQIGVDKSRSDLGLQSYVCGVLEVSRQPNESATGFQALIAMCTLPASDTVEGFPITKAVPAFEPGYAQPISYGGMSGGGFWLLSGTVQEKTDRRVLAGIAYYEIQDANGQLVICCHAINSALELLEPRVKQQW